MKRYALGTAALFVVLALTVFIAGCTSETTMRRVADEAIADYKASFAPETFGFGVAWEAGYSYAQGVKVGNMIFVSGQLSHDRELNEQGYPATDMMTGKDFDFQLRQTLDNVKAVLEHYGATMDDVVMLQNFVDPEAGPMTAGNWMFEELPVIISEYFPNAQHTMTVMEVTNLFGGEQLVESNAIAVVH
ncbi:MAG: Rid family hydrolase [Candidatus Omnitrophota bacterium]